MKGWTPGGCRLFPAMERMSPTNKWDQLSLGGITMRLGWLDNDSHDAGGIDKAKHTFHFPKSMLMYVAVFMVCCTFDGTAKFYHSLHVHVSFM